MILSLDSIDKMEKNNFEIVKEYLKIKLDKNLNITEEKINEIFSIKKFIKESIKNINDLNICNVAFCTEIFKHEHDALLFFYKNDKYIILDIEVKKNSSKECAKNQVEEHIRFLTERLGQKKYKIYGVSYIIDKNKCFVLEIINLKNNRSKLISKKLSFISLLNKIIKKNFVYINDPLFVIKNMEGNINEIIQICNEKKIDITKGEEDLIEWIKIWIKSYDILVINANGGEGKTTILLNLFFNHFSDESSILFNNYRIQFQVNEEFSRIYNKKYFFYYPHESNHCLKKTFLFVDEAQRLTLEQIHDLKKNFKKIILFGDKHQYFDNKYTCDYENIDKILSEKFNYKCIYKNYSSDVGRRFSKNFLPLVKHILNSNKYRLPEIKNNYLKEKIFIYDNVEDFLNRFSQTQKNKKIFCQVDEASKICSLEEFKKYNFSELRGYKNPKFAFDTNYNEIGTVYNAFSFEINYNFVIVSSNKHKITNERHIFNELYTLFTRTKNELHILFLSNDLSHYCDTYNILQGK